VLGSEMAAFFEVIKKRYNGKTDLFKQKKHQ